MTPRVIVLSAPSGGGKTTISKELLRRRSDIGYSVSATTRPPRPGEVDGRDYVFLTPETFAKQEAAGEFLETAVYAGCRYGTRKSEVDRVLASGRHVLLDIEVHGAVQVREVYRSPLSVAIFVLPPSASVLLERLRQRRSESETALAERLKRGQWELEQLQAALASAYLYDRTVINDTLDRAVQEISEIIDEVPTVRKRPPEELVGALIKGLGTELPRFQSGV